MAESNIVNILSVYNQSTKIDRSSGLGWYAYAKIQCSYISEISDISLDRVVYATAALSPQLRWESNISATRAVATRRVNSYPGCYTANIEKAHHILFDTVDWQKWLSGPKVECFALNILGNMDVVTVDTWAWRIWMNPVDFWAKPKGINHGQIQSDYVEAARIVGMNPAALQAVTWITIRRLANGKVTFNQLSLDI